MSKPDERRDPERPSDPNRVSLAFVTDVNSPRFSRRSFLGTMAFASAAGFLAACGSSGSSKSGSSSPNATAAKAVNAKNDKKLNFYNWTEYIDDKAIPNFQKQTGIKVTYDTYESNDVLYAKLSAGSTGYDLVVPTDATLVKMIHADLLEKLDLSQIPNRKNLDPRFTTAAYDPGNQYSIPWQWGTTGIGFDKTKVGGTVDDWDAFTKLPNIKGRSSYLAEMRDAYAMALFALGKDPNTTNTSDLDDATQYLIDLKKTVKAIDSNYQDPLKSGEYILSQAYSGDVFQAMPDNPHLAYAIPKSGAYSWVDNMAIPKGAPHALNAHMFMNYMLEPKVGAALTNFVSYGSPNKAAEPFIDKSITGNPLIYPPADVLANLQFQKDIGDAELEYADRWTKVKSA